MSNLMKIFALAGFLSIVSVPGVAQADWYVEAEHIHTNPSYPYAIGYGWGAFGDAFYQLNWTGSPGYEWFYVGTAGWYNLHVRLAGSVCNGYPVAQLLIDARVVGRRAVGPGWSHQTSDAAWLEVGWHSFAVAFENDYANSSCDRNIWYDAVWMPGNTWR